MADYWVVEYATGVCDLYNRLWVLWEEGNPFRGRWEPSEASFKKMPVDTPFKDTVTADGRFITLWPKQQSESYPINPPELAIKHLVENVEDVFKQLGITVPSDLLSLIEVKEATSDS